MKHLASRRVNRGCLGNLACSNGTNGYCQIGKGICKTAQNLLSSQILIFHRFFGYLNCTYVIARYSNPSKSIIPFSSLDPRPPHPPTQPREFPTRYSTLLCRDSPASRRGTAGGSPVPRDELHARTVLHWSEDSRTPTQGSYDWLTGFEFGSSQPRVSAVDAEARIVFFFLLLLLFFGGGGGSLKKN